ncbi:putative titin-like [Scophthalmus maximus]|uniref:Putative titin-like n=2 Tax=Scophthalmus maximus TaxID=52904 RepID=A0A2U9BKY3_SCOMX|nr:putative titin-like [Scophthalmus maximus]
MPDISKKRKEDKGSKELHEGLLISCVYKTPLYATDEIQRELGNESKSHADSVSQDRLLLKNLRSKQDALSQEMVEELQVEREKKQILLKEEVRVRDSYQEDSQRYEVNILTVRQRAHNPQRELDTEIESLEDGVSRSQLLLQNLRAKQVAVRQKTTEEFQVEREKTQILQEELDRVRTSYQENIQRYEADMLTVRQRADDQQCELEKLQILTNASPDAKPMQNEVPEEIPMKQKASTWERVQHFQGLRKPQIWEKPKDPATHCTSYQEDSQKYEAERFTMRQLVDKLPSMMCKPGGFSASPATAGRLTRDTPDVPDEPSFSGFCAHMEMVIGNSTCRLTHWGRGSHFWKKRTRGGKRNCGGKLVPAGVSNLGFRRSNSDSALAMEQWTSSLFIAKAA